jgi:hypothetical protein
MRVYIIGNDGITLCRTAPAAVNDGEIAVASNEELRAAPLSAKRLLALWNALPGVEKRKKVGDRDALIDQLWSAIEGLPDPEPQPDPKPPTKQDVVIAMLRLPEGATVDEVASVTGSVALSAARRVAPSRGRGSKPESRSIAGQRPVVAPSRGRGSKHGGRVRSLRQRVLGKVAAQRRRPSAADHAAGGYRYILLLLFGARAIP